MHHITIVDRIKPRSAAIYKEALLVYRDLFWAKTGSFSLDWSNVNKWGDQVISFMVKKGTDFGFPFSSGPQRWV